MQPVSPSIPIALILLSLFHILPAFAQKIDYTAFPGFENFEICLQWTFLALYEMPDGYIQCTTIPCMCEPETIHNNEPYLYSAASLMCTGTGQAKSATSIVDQVCSDAGSTVRIDEVEPQTTEGKKGMFLTVY